MSTSVPLGIVSLKAEGAYSADKLYKKGMWVTSSGSSYAYINPIPAAGVPVTDTSHWQQIASIGGQDLVDAAVAARDAAQAQAALAQGYAAQLAAGTASPAGTYADLAALISADPDHSKIYITLNDGNWCYWNGSAFVAGGVYQATERPLDTTLSVSGMAADAKVTGDKVGELKSATNNLNDELNNKANIDGKYDELCAGTAEQLTISAGEDNIIYVSRKIEGKNRKREKLVGGTICFNQMINKSAIRASAEVIDIAYTNNGDGSVIISGTPSQDNTVWVYYFNVGKIIANHVYLFGAVGGYDTTYNVAFDTIDCGNEGFGITKFAGIHPGNYQIKIRLHRNVTVNMPRPIYPMLFDLTKMFGNDVANYFYALEQTNSGDGCKAFLQLFEERCYDFTDGLLKSVIPESYETTGFNLLDNAAIIPSKYINPADNLQWNEQSNAKLCHSDYIRVLPGETYYTNASAIRLVRTVLCYDSEKTPIKSINITAPGEFTTPLGCYYVIINSSTEQCHADRLNVNYTDTGRNGLHEDYKYKSYDFDDVELHGIWKIGDSGIYSDGDIYYSDGTVDHKYEKRAYQSGDELLANAITDGTNTVAEKDSITHETVDPFAQLMDVYETETLLASIPTGHDTDYYISENDKVMNLPDMPARDGDYIIHCEGGKMTASPYTSSFVQRMREKVYQMESVEWVALGNVPNRAGETLVTAGSVVHGIPYSSVKQYDKYVGFNVSFRTFLTAAKNPYSLLYTENVNGQNSHSEYGYTYLSGNCGAYFGQVCNTFVEYASGMNIQWNTAEFQYLCRLGIFALIPGQSADGVEPGDIIWNQGHGSIVTRVDRNETGKTIAVEWNEADMSFSRSVMYSAVGFNARLASDNCMIYRNAKFYKNIEGPEQIDYITYNPDVCTFAGDYAAFAEGDTIWINYNLGSRIYEKLRVMQGNTQIAEYTLADAPSVPSALTGHAISIGNNLTPGLYTATLVSGNTASEPTHFEVVECDVTISAANANGDKRITFSSANGSAIYAQNTGADGTSYGIYPITKADIDNAYFDLNPQKMYDLQHPNNGTVPYDNSYLKLFFRGMYGIVSKPLKMNDNGQLPYPG